MYSSRNSLLNTMLLCLLGVGMMASGCKQKSTSQEDTPAPQLPLWNNTQLTERVQKYSNEPTLSLYRSNSGSIENLPLEQYIEGVVAGEIGSDFPPEARKAQAVIARSMTLALMELEGGMQQKHGTDVSDDHTEFQAYQPDAVTDAIHQAVQETRGIILTFEGDFAYTLFHAVSDGMTASIEEAFPRLADAAPYLVPVATDGITQAPEKYRNWEVILSVSEVAAVMGLQDETLHTLTISEYGASGRALTLSANDGKQTLPATEFRQAIGFDRLYSTVFHSIEIRDGQVIFQGSGWGHGAGMEQWGMWDMAEKGANYMEIAAHYFPRLQFTQLYE